LPSIKKKRELLKQILESEIFKDKEVYKKLLTYLVEASLKDQTPKEVTIAQDVFNKGIDFDGSIDTTVRVYAHNLRDKLDQYYQSEGKNHEIKLQIPKGHYRVEFVSGEDLQVKKNNNKTSVYILYSLIGLLIIYIVLDKTLLHNYQKYDEWIDTNSRIWSNFFNNNYPNSVLIGDFLVFHEYDNQLNRARRIQDYQINTMDELVEFRQTYNGREIDSWELGELPHNSIFNIVDIHSVFVSYKQRFKIDFSSEIDINFIKNRNIIYIGEFKNLRSLSDLLTNIPIKYQTLPWWQGELSYQSNDSLFFLRTSHDWEVSRYVVDIGLVAKLPGPNRENYLILCGFGYDSQIKIVEILSRKSSLINLEPTTTSASFFLRTSRRAGIKDGSCCPSPSICTTFLKPFLNAYL